MSKWEVFDCGPAGPSIDRQGFRANIDGGTPGDGLRRSFEAPTFDEALTLARAECERRNAEPRRHGPWVEVADWRDAEPADDENRCRFAVGRTHPNHWSVVPVTKEWGRPDNWAYVKLEPVGAGDPDQFIFDLEKKLRDKSTESTEADVDRLAKVLHDNWSRPDKSWQDVARAAYREILK